MSNIQYIDDFDNAMEALYVFDLEENNTSERATQTSHIPITSDSYKAAQRVYNPIQRSTTIKPYKGELLKPPSIMVFATWNEQVAYANAWNSRKTKRKKLNTKLNTKLKVLPKKLLA